MKAEEYEIMFKSEKDHWWYGGMEVISRALIEKFYPKGGSIKILDAGCGTGGMTTALKDYGSVYAFDISLYALELLQKREPTNLCCGSVEKLPYKCDFFDLITSFDVLCLKGLDDEAILREFRQILAPGGRIFLRLPACPWVRGAHDRAVDIGQRYRLRDLRKKIEKSGFHLEHLTHINMWLFPLAVLKRWMEFLLPYQKKSDLYLSLGPLNRVFKAILSSEAPMASRICLPVGLTAVVIARKK